MGGERPFAAGERQVLQANKQARRNRIILLEPNPVLGQSKSEWVPDRPRFEPYRSFRFYLIRTTLRDMLMLSASGVPPLSLFATKVPSEFNSMLRAITVVRVAS